MGLLILKLISLVFIRLSCRRSLVILVATLSLRLFPLVTLLRALWWENSLIVFNCCELLYLFWLRLSPWIFRNNALSIFLWLWWHWSLLSDSVFILLDYWLRVRRPFKLTDRGSQSWSLVWHVLLNYLLLLSRWRKLSLCPVSGRAAWIWLLFLILDLWQHHWLSSVISLSLQLLILLLQFLFVVIRLR